MIHALSVLKSAAILAIWLLFIAGCEDPSNVGLGVIGEDEVEPVRVRLEGSDLPAERSAAITGGIRSGNSFSGAGRYLVGIADDPVFGRITATTYIDYSISLASGTQFRNGTVTSVGLYFLIDGYVYGDTTASYAILVSDMDESWSAFAATSDTVLAAGDSVLSLPFDQLSGTFFVSMPADWVERNAAVLIDPDFPDVFDGFQISANGSARVTGFDGVGSYMRVITTTGTVDYPASKILTTLSKDEPAPIAGRTVIQDGFGDNAILDFGFEADSIAGAAVSRTVVEVTVDLSVYENPPPHFVRPVPTSLDLIGLRSNDTRRVLRSASILADGRVSFVSSTASAGEFTLVRSVQLAVTGNSQFDRYAIAISDAQAAIAGSLLYTSAAGENVPEAVITIVPSPFLP